MSFAYYEVMYVLQNVAWTHWILKQIFNLQHTHNYKQDQRQNYRNFF